MTTASGGEMTRDEATPRRVLLATDTSSASGSAEKAAIELAARVGASLIVLSVIDPSRLRLPGGLFHTRVDQVRAQREAAVTGIVEEARRRGIAAQFLIWEGDPGTSVVEAALAEGADVIVVGSHARGPFGRLLLGSVSSFVVDHGGRRVVVIPPGRRLDDVWAGEANPDAAGQLGMGSPRRRVTPRPEGLRSDIR
jgi:nucleotide-binding universal stress UspA family protein